MNDGPVFGLMILGLAIAFIAAVASNVVSTRVRVPAPALFLVAAALAAQLFPHMRPTSHLAVERLVTVALVLILFDGGMQIGLPRFRAAAGPIVRLGVAGTVLTAGGLCLVAHLVLGLGWRESLLLATALAPTDPAVVFSVLGGREISGPTGTILQGESGANDPVGIALMVALLGSAGAAGSDALVHGVGTFALQMCVGAVVGVAGGFALVWAMRRMALPSEALYPVRAVACAFAVYGVAAAAHGSGFLAVLLAGIIAGEARAPYKHEVERFAGALSSVAEIVVFATLGLTIDLAGVFGSSQLWMGLTMFAALTFLVRPGTVALLLSRAGLGVGERVFLMWGGLKGAVPILLGLFVVTSGTAHAHQVYGIVFVVVLASVVLQGGLIPAVARWCRVPMRNAAPEPWAAGLRFSSEPEGLHRYYVARGAPADGVAIEDLDLGEDAWVSMVSRAGRLVQVRGETELVPGDEVLVLGGPEERLRAAFTRRHGGGGAR